MEHLYGKMAARAKICEWIASTMKVFRGSEKPFYPVTWYSIDVDKVWVFSEIMNRMKDPGDGSIHEAPCITILRYGGDGLWSNEEDEYNPMNFMPMSRNTSGGAISWAPFPRMRGSSPRT